MRADRRLYLDRTQSRLVEESDTASAWLLSATGLEIPAEDVKRLGLVLHEGRVMQASQIPAPKVVELPVAPQNIEMTVAMKPVEERAPIMPPQSRRRK